MALLTLRVSSAVVALIHHFEAVMSHSAGLASWNITTISVDTSVESAIQVWVHPCHL